MRGWIVRATHTLDISALAVVAGAVVAVVGLAAAAYCYRRAGDGWALLVAALTGLLVSPISWSHHWVWCVPLLALAWYQARWLLIPTLLVFWTQVVRLVPHGDHVELDLGPGWIAMSGWYVVYATGFVIVAVVVARRSRYDSQWSVPSPPSTVALPAVRSAVPASAPAPIPSRSVPLPPSW